MLQIDSYLLHLKNEFLIHDIIRTSLHMNNKEKVLVEIFILLGFGVAALVISMTSGTAALAQDQNPPATGKQHQRHIYFWS
jgi:hypothetical protein